MVNEELYIIVEGERRKLDLLSPSGITLNYVSNLFNDLSKINASYSYTFKLPRTANNVRVLELADDIRANSKFTRVKGAAEFVYDGVSLFHDANLYVSGVEKESISGVMTWNVNKGLQELEKHDMSLNELGNHLPEGEYDYVGDEISDYEKDKVVLIGTGIYDDHSSASTGIRSYYYSQSLLRPDFAKYTDYDPTQPYFRSLHNGGTPPYRVPREYSHSSQGSMRFINTYPLFENASDGKLSPMPFVSGEETVAANRLHSYLDGEKKPYIDDDHQCHYPIFPIPAPIVPVPYIMDIISKVFGVSFDLSGDLYNALCVPLVNTEMSDALARKNYAEVSYLVNDGYIYISVARIVNNILTINPLSNMRLYGGDIEDGDHGQPCDAFSCDTVIDTYSKMKMLVWGKIKFKVRASGGMHHYDDKTKPTLSFWCATYDAHYTHGTDDFYHVGSVYAAECQWRYENGVGYEEITFNLNPEEGFKIFESEDINRSFVRINLTNGEPEDNPYDTSIIYDILDSDGYLKISFKTTDYPMGCYINLFKNLPDISCLDFVKAIFYALGGYPYQDADGKIKIQQYAELIQSINNGAVYNWQNKSLKGVGNNTEDFDYDANNVTGLTLGRKNYYLMKNDKVDDYGNEEENDKLEDAYEHGYECIEVDSDMLEKTQTIFTFPFQGGFLWSKGYYHLREYLSTIPLATNQITGMDGVEIYEGDLTLVSLIGQDRWIISDEGCDGSTSFRNPRYKSQEAKPMLGVVQPIRVPIATFTEILQNNSLVDDEHLGEGDESIDDYYTITYQNEDTQYLSMRPWNCKADMPKVNGHDLLQELFSNPCLVKEDMLLNVKDLAFLDIEKPVFLEKYNSYFAIKNIEVGTDGTSKVELIRIPTEILVSPVSQQATETPDSNENNDNNGGEDFEEVPVEW